MSPSSKHHLNHLWLIFAAYGVWFAVFSGLEEVNRGKFWKASLSLILGVAIYLILERKVNRD